MLLCPACEALGVDSGAWITVPLKPWPVNRLKHNRPVVDTDAYAAVWVVETIG